MKGQETGWGRGWGEGGTSLNDSLSSLQAVQFLFVVVVNTICITAMKRFVVNSQISLSASAFFFF